jgi:crossover junction endodeoxyribonuclease RusA
VPATAGDSSHPSTLVVTIPKLHPSINEWRRWDWRRRRYEVEEWKKLVRLCVGRPRLFAVPVHVTVSYFFPTRGRCDPDNYSPKFVMDGFVGSLLEDDDFDHVQSLAITRGGVDRERPRTEVVFVPVG